MQRTDLRSLPLIAALVATAAWSFGTESRVLIEEPSAEAPCSATLRPESVLAEDDDVLLSVVFAPDPGDLTAARSEAGSGIRVISFDPPSDDLASEWVALLDLSEAVVGSWRLEFEGDRGICAAQLVVNESAPGRIE